MKSWVLFLIFFKMIPGALAGISEADSLDGEIIEPMRVTCERALSVGLQITLRPPTLESRISARREALKSILATLTKTRTELIRTERQRAPRIQISAEAHTESFLHEIYKENLLSLSRASIAMSLDKVMTAELFQSLLGESDYERHFAKTFGFFEFARRLELVDDSIQLLVSEEVFTQRVLEYFPSGLVFKPTESAKSRERGQIFFNKAAIAEMYRTLNERTRSEALWSGTTVIVEGHIVEITGEEFLIQELLPGFHESREKMQEYRVHTLEDQVVQGATFKRWSQSPFPVSASQIEDQVNALIKSWPAALLKGTALSLDVLLSPDGKIKIIEINSPQSQFGWSGYLMNPLVLSAYVRKFEADYNVQFTGWNGVRLRMGTANLKQGIARWREQQVNPVLGKK